MCIRDSVVVVLFVVIQSGKLHTDSAEVPVLHTPVEVAKVRFSMTCGFVDGQGKRGNVHIYIPFCSSPRRRCELYPFQQREVILEDGKSETGSKQ